MNFLLNERTAMNSKKIFNKDGLTLIELLVLIVLIGILAIAVWVAIDPQDKVRASSDAQVQSQLEALVHAETVYYSYRGLYTNSATAQQDLLARHDLRIEIVPPPGYDDFRFIVPDDCDISGSDECDSIVICIPMLSKKYRSSVEGAQQVRLYSSVSGKVCDFDNGADECNNLTSTQVCP